MATLNRHMALYARLDSAFGPLLLRARGGKLTGLWFADDAQAPAVDPDWKRDDQAEIFAQTIRELDEFARGARRTFDVPCAMSGSPFQMLVWQAIAAIPFGETATCGDLAQRIGGIPRAVGTAARRNPIGIIVPSHRVTGTDDATKNPAGSQARRTRLRELERAASFATCATHAP